MIRNIAIILAAGAGERTGFSQPKQLLQLAGRPIVAHTIERFQRHPEIDEIAIVTGASCRTEIERLVIQLQATKTKKVILGGRERYESSLAAIRAYDAEAGVDDVRLIFHDGVRPLVTDRIISDVIDALNHSQAVDVTIPATDTVIVTDRDTNTIHEIPDRRFIHIGQTPQAFKHRTIKAAYDLALRDPTFRTTDDCGVVVKYLPEEKVYLVRGDPINHKLTFPADLLILDTFMQCSANRRLDVPADSLALSTLRNRALVIFGGSSGIGASMARLARSYGAKVHSASRSTGLDVADAEAVGRYLDEVTRTSQRIDAIVNTVAVLNRQPLANMTAEEVSDSLQTNVFGAINIARLAFRHLQASRGHLMFFASNSCTYGRAYYSLNGAATAAMVNLTRTLADEWSEAGIHVNCVNPERTDTPMRVRPCETEPPETLLDADEVARKALGVLVGTSTGFIYDITQ